MRSLWPAIRPWIDSGDRFAMATVVATVGSAARAPGSCMAIAPGGTRFIGSVSSGCLEAEIVNAACAATESAAVRRFQFGPDGNAPWTDGLTCGGRVDVRVERWWGCDDRPEIHEVGSAVRRWLERDEPGLVVSAGERHLAVDATGRLTGEVGSFDDVIVAAGVRNLVEDLPPAEWLFRGEPVFVRTIRRRPRLLIAGGADVGGALVAFAREAGFATFLVDPREAFLDSGKFGQSADLVRRAWPHHFIPELGLGSRDSAVVLTHDPKIDDPALQALLETPVGYIGAMGGKRSHALRLERLRSQGVSEPALSRIQGPAGMHLGALNARGIALGILAGIVQWQAGDERRRLARALACNLGV